jgi:outer membrane protein assembly factor BamB
MKKQIIFLTLLLLCSSCIKKEKLLIGGSGWQQIAIVDKSSGKIEWNHPLDDGDECNDLEMTPDGKILYAHKQGARLIARDHQVIWEYKAGEGEELFTATRLESGNYMVALCGVPARIVELDRKGTPVKELTFNMASPDVHRQFRQILKTPHNTYLIPFMSKGKVSEIDENGRIINSVLCGGTPFSVKLTGNGHWLVSCGDGRSFVEINPETRTIVKTVETSNLNWGSLLFVAELIRYKNGNTLIANWNGHSNDKSQPLLFETDSTNHIVWRLPAHPEITNISAVCSFFD